MNWQQKIINIMTICKKADKLVLGFDAVQKCILDGSAYCVVVAEDISPRTFIKIKVICDVSSLHETPVLKIGLKVRELEYYFNRKVAVAAICDRGFAKKIETLVNSIS